VEIVVLKNRRVKEGEKWREVGCFEKKASKREEKEGF
jgi:hypothetical protein